MKTCSSPRRRRSTAARSARFSLWWTHIPTSFVESQEVLKAIPRVVVIDHHRMAVGHIDNPTLICHEPYASSASELVCELLQFMPKENNITPLEAQALLAGIMLDTRSFCTACRRAHL